MILKSGSSLSILRKWVVNEKDIWARVELATNRFIEHPNRTKKGWIKMLRLDLDIVFHILVGSTLGLILRLFIQNNFKKKKTLYFNSILIVNVLSSLFLGSLLALSLTNKKLLLLFSVGFLGCFSTFSSFIYQLFNLIQKRKYLRLFIYYLEVLVISFLFFCLGYFIILIFQK